MVFLLIRGNRGAEQKNEIFRLSITFLHYRRESSDKKWERTRGIEGGGSGILQSGVSISNFEWSHLNRIPGNLILQDLIDSLPFLFSSLFIFFLSPLPLFFFPSFLTFSSPSLLVFLTLPFLFSSFLLFSFSSSLHILITQLRTSQTNSLSCHIYLSISILFFSAISSNSLRYIYSVYYSFIAIFFKVASPWSVCRSWEDIWTACQNMSKQVSTDTNCFVRVRNRI